MFDLILENHLLPKPKHKNGEVSGRKSRRIASSLVPRPSSFIHQPRKEAYTMSGVGRWEGGREGGRRDGVMTEFLSYPATGSPGAHW